MIVPSIKLTRPDGSPIWLNSAGIASLSAPIKGQYAKGTQCVVELTGQRALGVCETPEQVMDLIKAHGGAEKR